MVRRVFFSFHVAHDFWRTQQVRNMNALEGRYAAIPDGIETWIERAIAIRNAN